MVDYDRTSPQKILSISELNRLARDVLQTRFPLIWVSGEISNFTKAASGHWYFSLKDASAQVRCVMFKGRNSYVDFMPKAGDTIEARATVGLYEARGDFQLTIEFIQQAGLGALFEAFEKLKRKLEQEGLFDVDRKRVIPTDVSTIGIVTSADAAALRDVLTTLKRRNPNVAVIIYPTPVQGKGAAKLIANAISKASQRQEVDTLIICRGGGSIEDLWQFNEEVVARAIADCPLPTISGVGHETDFTICDFVADLRAATPTAAAELACEDMQQRKQKLKHLQKALNRMMDNLIYSHAQKLDYLAKRLISPKQKLITQHTMVNQLQNRLKFAMQKQLQDKHQRLKYLQNSLEQLSPTSVMSRGYAIVTADSGTIKSVDKIQPGQDLSIQFHQGNADVKVVKKY